MSDKSFFDGLPFKLGIFFTSLAKSLVVLVLPEVGVKYISFYLKFEQSLFRSKFDLDLNEVIFDIQRFNTFIPKDC